MSKAPAPTSEWADLFDSLSLQDTSDTIDTRSDDGRETGPSVATVKAVVTIGWEASATPQPAETLDFSDADKPSVASVASVTIKREKGVSEGISALSPIVDTIAPLAT